MGQQYHHHRAVGDAEIIYISRRGVDLTPNQGLVRPVPSSNKQTEGYGVRVIFI